MKRFNTCGLNHDEKCTINPKDVMMDTYALVRSKRKLILETAARYGASHVRIFGSVSRGTADEDSDIDFLVKLDSDHSLFDLGGLLYELRQLLCVKVDVVTENGLRKRIKETVLLEAVDI